MMKVRYANESVVETLQFKKTPLGEVAAICG